MASIHLSRLLKSSTLPILVVGALMEIGASIAQATGDASASFATYALTQPIHSQGQAATLLPDGRWLLIAGLAGGKPSGAIKVLDPSGTNPSTQTLSASLAFPRANHTATVLPDGQVLIFGGSGPDGALISDAELFDPQSNSLQTLPDTGLTPRTQHTATLLTNGLVLIAGGLDRSGNPDPLSELYNPKTRQVEPGLSPLITPRSEHRAALLADGSGLVWGGKDAGGNPLGNGELYDPTLSSFSSVGSADDPGLPTKALALTTPRVADSLPQADATDIPVDSLVAVRFTEPMKVQTVSSATVTLVGPTGAVSSKVTPAEGGMLAFLTPGADLSPGSTYTLFLNGLTDVADRPLPFSSFSFRVHRYRADAADAQSGSSQIKIEYPASSAKVGKTQPTIRKPLPAIVVNRAPTPQDEKKKPEEDDWLEDWLPSEQNHHGNWRVLGLPQDPVLRFHPAASSVKVASIGATALSGQIARLNGKPLAGVPVSIGTRATTTDADGRFLLSGLDPGVQTLKVDGTAVVSGGRHYTKHFIEVRLQKGQTIAIPSTIYLPRVDPAQEVSIASPMDKELVLTHPAIPGLEVHIPQGTVLREYDGKVVTKLSITPIPVDRAPYPAPIDFSVYFTLQPGGAFVDGDPSKTVKIIYPNYQHLPAGAVVDFWNYDPNGGGWKVYTHGVVSADGKKVIPDVGLGFRQIMSFGFGISQSSSAPATGPIHCGDRCGDPVDVATGLFLHDVTDMAISDVVSIAVRRTYHQNDSASHAFGTGATLSYMMYLENPGNASLPATLNLVLANGSRIPFPLQSGNSMSNAVWSNMSPTEYSGATLISDATLELFYLTLSNGTKFTFGTHHTFNQLQAITDRYGNTVTLTIPGSSLSTPGGSSSGKITQITSPNGRYIQLTYDGSNRVTQATDNIGRTVTYTYGAPNCPGCLWKVTDANQHTEQYGYTDPVDYTRLTTVTDKRGNVVTTNTYDETTGRVVKQTLGDQTFWQFSYGEDSIGNAQTTITDPRGNVEVKNFNSNGYVTKDVLALGQPEQQTYVYQRNSSNLVGQVTDPLGRVTNYTYDAYGDITSITRLYGTSSAVSDLYGYDPVHHQLASHTDPLSHTTQINYDPSGNPVSVVDPLNHTTILTFNGQGLPVSATDPLSHTSSFGYQQGDLASVTDALSRTSSLFTDGAGRLLSIVDPLGNKTLYGYDNLNRVLQVTDPTSGVTTMTYDPNGNLTAVLDPRQIAAHGFSYDARDRLQTKTDPLGKSESYVYDGLGNLTQYTDRKSQITQYSYDSLNRPKKITFQDGSTIQIAWDAGNRPTNAVDSLNGTISWVFDSLDRLTSETTPQGTVGYSYDVAGRRVQLVPAVGSPVNYCYDGADRLTSLITGTSCSSPTVVLTSFVYDNSNRRTGLTLPNGVVATYGYDNANELTSIGYVKSSATIGSISYSYDGTGRRITRASTLDQTTAPANIASSTYDAANRLMARNGAALTYDNNGNLTSDGTNTYAWNVRDQLTASSAQTSSFGYDALGRRNSRTVNGTSLTFQYDGSNLTRELSGTNTFASYLTGLAIDETYARTDSTGTQTNYLEDALGSTVGLTDVNGTLIAGYSYDAYGNTTPTTDATTNPIQYTGRENDGTGLYYYRARYYSPALRRFISQDPIGLAGGINQYAYVLGNPISFIDPTGLDVTVSVFPGENGNPGGHIALGVNTQNTVGLAPAPGASTLRVITDLSVPAIMEPTENGRQPESTITIHTTPQQDQRVQNYINRMTRNPGSYRISGPNCATTVHDALDAGGINSPDTMWPRDLIRGLQQIQNRH